MQWVKAIGVAEGQSWGAGEERAHADEVCELTSVWGLRWVGTFFNALPLLRSLKIESAVARLVWVAA